MADSERLRQVILAFPGQGSQRRGMGQDLHQRSEVARLTFEEASDTLGINMTKICFEDPNNQLEGATVDTQVVQPALVTVSVATVRHLKKEAGIPSPVAHVGHSLGKISAAADQAMDFSTALKLAWHRGQLMREGVTNLGTKVGVILGLDSSQVERQLDKLQGLAPSVKVTVVNTQEEKGGQLLIGGLAQEVDRAFSQLAEQAKKIIPYPNAPLSHHPLMEDVQGLLNSFLSRITEHPVTIFKDPLVPIWDDVSERVLTTASDFEASLHRHLVDKLVWPTKMERMASMGITDVIEVGPSKVLAGFFKRQKLPLQVHLTDSFRDLQNLYASFGLVHSPS